MSTSEKPKQYISVEEANALLKGLEEMESGNTKSIEYVESEFHPSLTSG